MDRRLRPFWRWKSTNWRPFKCNALDKSWAHPGLTGSGNETEHQQCDNKPTIEKATQKRRLQWFEHVCRIDICRLPYKLLWCQWPPTWKVRRHAPKNTWVKQVKYSLHNRHTLVDAKTLSTDPLAWSQVAGRPSAPTAAYERRRRIRHNTSCVCVCVWEREQREVFETMA